MRSCLVRVEAQQQGACKGCGLQHKVRMHAYIIVIHGEWYNGLRLNVFASFLAGATPLPSMTFTTSSRHLRACVCVCVRCCVRQRMCYGIPLLSPYIIYYALSYLRSYSLCPNASFYACIARLVCIRSYVCVVNNFL